jgi:hypothetical protein
MKKIIILSGLLIFVFLVLFIVSRDQPQELAIVFVEELEESSPERLKACVQRRDGKLVLVDVEKKNNENIYLYILKLYDHYRNSLPPTYLTPLAGNFEVRKLEKNKNKLAIELEILYLTDNFNTFLTALMWSYQQLGIEEIEVRVGKEVFRREKNAVINPEIETANLLEACEQVVVYQQGDALLPVTYYHDREPLDFLLAKITTRFQKVEYRYEMLPETLIIYLDDPDFEISGAVIESLVRNLQLLDYSRIAVIKNNLIIYQE